MEEKKLTDEEELVVKLETMLLPKFQSIEYWDVPRKDVQGYYNVIHRLQSELKKELAEHEEFTKKANAEIERLTEELDLANETIDRNNKRYEKVSIELQKALDRVDFLEDALLDKIRRNEELITAIKQVEKQAVKETVEKIADWLDNEKGYCGLGYLIKREFLNEITEGKE